MDSFCIAYLDNILVYSNNKESYVKYIRAVLSKLREAYLFLDIDKYEFNVIRVKYLGLIITTEGLEMD